MKDRQQLFKLIVGVLGVLAIICGLFGIGRMSALWRLIHIAGGAVMAWSEIGSLKDLYDVIRHKISQGKSPN